MRAYLEELGLPARRRPLRRVSAAAARGRGARRALRRGARRPRRRARAVRAGASRRARPGRGRVGRRAAPAAARIRPDRARRRRSSASRELRAARRRTSTRTPPRRSSGSSRRWAATCARSVLALTGAERGPELWAVLVALPREEALSSGYRRVELRLHLPERGEKLLGGSGRRRSGRGAGRRRSAVSAAARPRSRRGAAGPPSSSSATAV